VLGNAVMLQAAQVAAAVLFINIYALFFEHQAHVRGNIALASVVFSIAYLANPFIFTLVSYEKMYLSGLISGAASFLNAVLIFAAIFMKLSLPGVILMLGVSNLLTVFIAAGLCLRYAILPVFSVDVKEIKGMLKMSFPFAVIALLIFVYSKIDTMLLYKIKGAEAAGVYSAVSKIMDLLNSLIVMVMSPLYPRLSHIMNLESGSAAGRVTGISVKYMAAVTAPFVLMISVLSREFTALVLGSKYIMSSAPLSIVVWTIFLMSLYVIPSLALQAARRTKEIAIMYAGVVAVNLGLNLALIGKYGYIAASWVSLLSHLLIFATLAVLLNLRVDRTNFGPMLAKITASLVPAGITMYFLNGRVYFLLAGAAGLVVYGAFMLLLRYLDGEDFAIAGRLFKKGRENGAA
jgi:O-antigen/teichoic acid export membrane protein